MKNKELIETLYNCAAACNHCADACLDEKDVKMMISCIRTDRECAAICESTAKLLAQGSASASQLLKVCKDVCTRCADECGEHDADHCQKCADACRKCAEACRKAA